MPKAERPAIRPQLYTVPFGTDLCDATAALVLDKCNNDPLLVSTVTLLLPNNRAIKAMTEAFVRRAKPGLLVPRLAAIGDLALDEALGPLLDPLAGDEAVLPAISPAARTMLLADLVIKHRPKSQPVSPAEALRLARNLADMIDELEIEEVGLERFSDMKVEADLAGHWQNSYGQLLAILPAYRDALMARSLLGPSERRNILLDRLGERLRDTPPAGLMIAAGITTAAKAVARVLSRVAILPQGCVILPGVDLPMADAQWDALGPHARNDDDIKPRRNHETHPQFHLKLLLHRMGFGRDEFEILSPAKPATQASSIADIFCLPEDTANWQNLPAAAKKMPHLATLEAADSAEEARAISVKVREALELPGQRIAVITPDRELAVRVAAQLCRWNVIVDDSAGTPILQTPNGTLIAALADVLANRFSPVSVLAVAKHPLVHAGEGRMDWLEQTRKLDLLLRGPSKGIGLKPITALVAGSENEELKIFWTGLDALLSNLAATANKPFSDIMDAIQNAAALLTDGAIWKGATGRQFAALWEEFVACDLAAIGRVERTAIPAIISEMFGRAVVRPPYGGHPRVAIYGLLEARMQHADFVICGGLNEGSWPQMAQPDPWLAPAIRRHLGLATLDRNIGLSAHDLSTALGAKQVLLTRAARDRSGPTVASRFMLRIKAFLGDQFRVESAAIDYAQSLDQPMGPMQPANRPQPMPGADQRRVTLSITDFDQLKSDPFGFYAKKILRLRVLDAVDAEPSHAWRGTLVHDILQKWFDEDGCAPAGLMKRAQALLTDLDLDPVLRALWQPRIAEGLRWIALETQRLQAEEGRSLLVAEQEGKMEMSGITITGRADRIDRLADGGLAIIDYKTGMPPKTKQVTAGFALQLGLVGLMAECGTIDGVSGSASRFEYWSLAKDKGSFGYIAVPTSKKPTDNKIDASDFVAFALREVEEALATWINGNGAFTAKLHPEYAKFEDYDQLMRLQEWNGRQPIVDGDAI
jgi:ATP-dependent helicase/nuclease subunit B